MCYQHITDRVTVGVVYAAQLVYPVECLTAEIQISLLEKNVHMHFSYIPLSAFSVWIWLWK